MRRLISVFLLAMLFYGSAPPPSAHADELAAPEYHIKASYVYNFLKFIELPRPPAGLLSPSLEICVMGAGDEKTLSEAFQTIAGKGIGGARLIVKVFPEEGYLRQCHVVFVARLYGEKYSLLLERLKDSGVLTIGEVPGFCENGGSINFLNENNTVQFEINTERAKKEHINIDQRLIRAARRTTGNGQEQR